MKGINQEHPDYTSRREMWRKYRDLYAGGEQFKANGIRYLERRQKEPADVYNERLGRIFYENYIGSIIDWYAATLFRREPLLGFEGADEKAKHFFGEFTDDCDLKGTGLTDLFRRQLIDALVFGSSYILVDFPRAPRPARNRAEEELLGTSRAYLMPYTPEDVINWSADERGSLEWVVIRTQHLRCHGPEAGPPVKETRWAYYDRENYRIYAEGTKPFALVAEGKHGLSRQGVVPLFDLKVTEGLWLMNKGALLQLEHFNKSNALAWALAMGLFAMPVVYSERPWNQIVGESYYIQLGQQDRFGWTEPEGKVYQIAASNLDRLKEEIYRVCYLVGHAGGMLAEGRPQSGLSKQRDFAITQEVLRAYGDTVKDALRRVLDAIKAAREDDLVVHVSGLDEFDISDFSDEIADAKQLLELGINSPTMRTQIQKKLALKFLCDARQEVKDRISQEIEESVARQVNQEA